MNTTKEIIPTCTCGKDLHIMDGHFTADNLIDAYIRGHKDGCKISLDIASILDLIKQSTTAINIMRENPGISISIMPCDSDSSINRISLKADNYIELLH